MFFKEFATFSWLLYLGLSMLFFSILVWNSSHLLSNSQRINNYNRFSWIILRLCVTSAPIDYLPSLLRAFFKFKVFFLIHLHTSSSLIWLLPDFNFNKSLFTLFVNRRFLTVYLVLQFLQNFDTSFQLLTFTGCSLTPCYIWH